MLFNCRFGLSLYLFLYVVMVTDCFSQNSFIEEKTFKENPDSMFFKPIHEEELPELFDKQIQAVTASAADSIDSEINGFRVQVYKTSTMLDSKEKQTLYVEMFGENNVKLIFEEPFYKIRVGNFRTRNEAENFQDELLKNGFRSTIVVPDKVIVKILKKH